MRYWLFTAALVLLALGTLASAEMLILPSTFQGYLVTDRWGRQVYANGSVQAFVSDDFATALKDVAGQPSAAKITKADTGRNGEGLVLRAAVEAKRVSPQPDLTLTARVKAAQIETGQGLRLEVSITNATDKPITARAESFAVVFTTNSIANEPKGWKDQEGRAYWYTGTFRMADDGKTRQYLRAHQVPAGLTAKSLVKDGRGIRAENDNVILDPKATYQSEVLVGTELPPGEYEALFTYGNPNFSSAPAPTSTRVPFDVAAPKP